MKYDTSRRFNPSKIECHRCINHQTIVTMGARKYYSNTLQKEGYIYSYASEKEQNNSSHTIIKKVYQDPSIASYYCYNLISNRVAKNIGVASSEIAVRKSKVGIPEIYHKNIKLNIHLSLTHHGHYAAYSIVY